ncbi:hypothetical protein [Bacillus cereus group sp. BceL293]|uniref:hypothetical protein n=1 Tax=Bacillus cereus group sp. BceL293 TaxID=3444992 RepID=UPI003F294D2B
MNSHSARKRFVKGRIESIKNIETKEVLAELLSKIENLEEENQILKRDLSHVYEELCSFHRKNLDGKCCPLCEVLAKKYTDEGIFGKEN